VSDRIEIPETAQVRVGSIWVSAANIWEREPVGRPGAPSGLSVQLAIGDEPAVDVQQGEVVSIDGARWRVGELVEDPVQRRGAVILERIQA
jgi:hypothetical protein